MLKFFLALLIAEFSWIPERIQFDEIPNHVRYDPDFVMNLTEERRHDIWDELPIENIYIEELHEESKEVIEEITYGTNLSIQNCCEEETYFN